MVSEATRFVRNANDPNDPIDQEKIAGNRPIPKEFALAQNYPNPFNPTTQIRYALPQPGAAKIEIFNILGQRVKTLVNESQPEGYYLLIWDGQNDQGSIVGSGVYFYQLTVKEGNKMLYHNIQKMLYLK